MDQIANKRSILFVVTIAAFLTPFAASSVNIALPAIGQELAMSAVLLSWVASVFLLAAAVFLVPLGRIADIYGKKRIFAYGISLYTVASLLIAIVTSASGLIIIRVFQGIGAAMIFSSGAAIITTVFSPGERGKALGINVAAVYLGLSLGPFLGGFLTQHFGWRSVFLINVPLGLIVLFLIFSQLKGEWIEARGEKFDFIGSLIYGLSLIAIMTAFSSLTTLSGSGLMLIGILGIILFFWWEKRTKQPILEINIFRGNKVFVFSNLAALINYMATFAVTFLLSLYLQYLQGMNPQTTGIVLVFQPVIMAIFSPLAGRLSDRIEPRIVSSLGMIFATLGLTIFIFLNEKTTLGFIVTGLIILGFGFALFSSPNTNAVMSSVEKKFYGVASATLGTMRLVGQMFSLGITTLVFDVHIGHRQITPEYYPLFLQSTKISFTIFAILCCLGIFASLIRGRLR